MRFRNLLPEEIEVRVARVTDKGAQLLLYKDARCDMRILDETVGAENWQREHYECKGNLFCRVGINTDGKGNWVYKSDCGSESNTEKEKGEASDSFKRACVNWGIGRELYTSPFIWIKQDGTYDFKRDRFTVSEIKDSDNRIVYLVLDAIVNYKIKEAVFTWFEKPKATRIITEPPVCPICGKETKDVRCKDGTIMSGEEVFRKYGMCADCKRNQNEPKG
jgi:hypothetical protein